MDKETIEVLKGLKDMFTEYFEKADANDRRLKDLEDNFHNQSPREFYAPNDISYGNAGKNQNREDLKLQFTKPHNASPLNKGEGPAKSVKKHLAYEEEGQDVEPYSELGDDVAGAGLGAVEDEEGLNKGMYAAGGDMPVDMNPAPVADPRDEELRDLRMMLKEAMSVTKSLTAKNDILLSKLEELTTRKSDEADVPMLTSNLPVRKSNSDSFAMPTRVDQMNSIVGDWDNTIDEISKGLVSKSGDINEGRLAQINKMRYEMGDLEGPMLPLYKSGIPGL